MRGARPVSVIPFPSPSPFPNDPMTSFDHERLDVWGAATDFVDMSDDLVEQSGTGTGTQRTGVMTARATRKSEEG